MTDHELNVKSAEAMGWTRRERSITDLLRYADGCFIDYVDRVEYSVDKIVRVWSPATDLNQAWELTSKTEGSRAGTRFIRALSFCELAWSDPTPSQVARVLAVACIGKHSAGMK